MKKILLVLMMGFTLQATAQQYPMYSRGMAVSYSDPAIANLSFTTPANTPADVSSLTVGQPVKLSFKLMNKEAINAVPAHTMQIKITLGSKFQLATALNQIPSLPLRDYFRWDIASAPHNSQLIITGELMEDLPSSFTGNVDFLLVPTRAGMSTATCQVMISNDNPNTVLSDIAPNNNYVSQTYNSFKGAAMSFVQFGALAHNCAVDMSWLISDENKQTKRFVIETSADGSNFVPVSTLVATGASSYSFTLPSISSKNITVRVKAELITGGFEYSTPKLLSNVCGGRFMVSLFPNPLAKELKEITLTAKEGVFNGTYVIQLVDAAGREITKTEATYVNQNSVKFNTGIIASGSYFVNIKSEAGESVSLPLVKQ